MTDKDPFTAHLSPSAKRPLLGLTLLTVEDSRYASDAMRLLCLRSGARMRRADSIRAAERHLQVYRPSVMIIDQGLPDGTGADLIDRLNRTTPRVDVILGTSGDEMAENMCLAAGADGFLAKPVQSLALFQNTILAHLPSQTPTIGPRLVSDDIITPDPIAYIDDMAHAAEVLGDECSDNTLDYLAQFVTGVAKIASDTPLQIIGERLSSARADKLPSRAIVAQMAGMIQDRLTNRVAI